MATLDPFNARRQLEVGGDYYALDALDGNGLSTKHLPYSIRVLLEGALRAHEGFLITEDDGRKTLESDDRYIIESFISQKEKKKVTYNTSVLILVSFVVFFSIFL